MKKPTILRTLIFVLALLFNFASYSQNWIADNSKLPKNWNENIFLNADRQSEDPLNTKDKKSENSAAALTNPVIPYAQLPYAGQVTKCPNDGKELPKLFLCGGNDSRQIKTNIVGAQSIIWERFISGSSCATVSNSDCANESAAASCWAQVATGPDYLANSAGQFRVKILDSTGTPYIYYFNVYQNTLIPTATTKSNIIRNAAGTCQISGQISVGGFGSGYEYSFTTTGTSGTFSDNNIFKTNTPGNYTAYIRIKDVVGSCEFKVINLDIKSVTLAVSTEVVAPRCYAGKGSIKVIKNDKSIDYIFNVYKPANSTTALRSFEADEELDYTFTELDPGTYRVETLIKETGCVIDNKNAVVIPNAPAQLTSNPVISTPLSPCRPGSITVGTGGGTYPFRYLVSINGAPFFQNANNVISTVLSGSYLIRIEDANGCSVEKTITVGDVDKPTYTISKTDGTCTDPNGKITINVTDNKGYSIETRILGENNYTSLNYNAMTISGSTGSRVYSNVPPENYIISVRYTKSRNTCTDPDFPIAIGLTTALTASAGVAELSGCGIAPNVLQGKVRITNAEGGVPITGVNGPYLYSYDGKKSWTKDKEAYVDPGTHIFYIKDANCEIALPAITLLTKPADPTIKVDDPVFNCDGSATSTVTVTNSGSGSPQYSYDYYMDGVLNTTTPTNVFRNVTQGDHTITVSYNVLSVPTESVLLNETFGSGPDVSSPGINPNFCWERQVEATKCNNNKLFANGEYTVTNLLRNNPYDGWWSPRDNTSKGKDSNGRFLAVDAGTSIPNNAVLYRKTINDIIPNVPVKVTFVATNLLKKGNNQPDASLTVELQNSSGVALSSQSTGGIPKTDGWVQYTRTINPGDNTSLDFVLRLELSQVNGIDFAVDDLVVTQMPKACNTVASFPLVVDGSKAFSAGITGYKDVKCNGESNGEITLSAKNFNPAKGFQYSVNGGNWQTVIPVPASVNGSKTLTGLSGGIYNIRIRYDDSAGSCTFPVAQEIKVPAALTLTAKVTKDATCDFGATITAEAKNGTPGYQYELRREDGVTVVPGHAFSTAAVFDDVAVGKYVVVAKDLNDCQTLVPARVEVLPPVKPTIDFVGSNVCFDKNTGTDITVKITGGVGKYTYTVKYNSNPVSEASQPFDGPNFTYHAENAGSYTFTVKDSYGCITETPIERVITEQLITSGVVTTGLDCDPAPSNQAVISGEIKGGKAPYKVTIISGATTGNLIQPTVTGNTFTYTIGTAGDYNFQVVDANGCISSTDIVTIQPLNAITLSSDNENPKCNTSNDGTIKLNPSGGAGGFKYSTDGLNYNDTSYFTGLSAGVPYTYYVRDTNRCVKSITITLVAPDNINGTASITVPYTCDNPATITVGAVVTGGNGNYKYTLNRNGVAIVTQDGKTFNNISIAGDYTVTIVDTNGCSFTTTPVLKIEVLNGPKSMTINKSALTCPDNKSEFSITDVKDAAGVILTGPFTYAITAPAGAVTSNTTGVFQNLNPGVTYTFEVKDAKNCSYSQNDKVDALKAFKVEATTVHNIKCLSDANGDATFTVTDLGNNVSYNYQIDALPLQTGNVSPATGTSFTIAASNLSVGLHKIVVTNNVTKCSQEEEVEIKAPAAVLDLDPTDVTDATCITKGSATIHPKGGWGFYTYEVTLAGVAVPASVPSNTFKNLEAGLYSFTVTDLRGCTKTDTFTIGTTEGPKASIAVTSDFCASGAGATLIATPDVAPQPNYRYSIDGSKPTRVSGTFTGLAPGKYTIKVLDIVTGCSIDLPEQTIAVPISATTKLLADLDCDVAPASPDATIEVTISNGYPDFKYRHNTTGAPFSGVFTDVAAGSNVFTFDTGASGTHYFEITDKNNCTTVVSRTINTKVNPSAVTVPTNPTCYNGTNGAIEVTASLGVLPYTYEVSTTSATTGFSPMATNKHTGIGAGTYWFRVTDAKKCQIVVSQTLTNPAELTAHAEVTQPLTCGPSNAAQAATITVTIDSPGTPYSGTNKYKYSYNGATPVPSNTFQTTATGVVTVDVYDANNCHFKVLVSPEVLALDKPSNMTFDVPAAITCETGKDKTDLTVNIQNGVAPFRFEITNTDAAVAPTAPIATGVTTQSHTFNDLVPGKYYFKVTDKNLCTTTGEFTIDNVLPVLVNGSLVSNVLCKGSSDGKLTFTVSGNSGAFTYVLRNSANAVIPNTQSTTPTANTIEFTGLAADVYTITITNPSTQCTATKTIEVKAPAVQFAFTTPTITPITCAPNNGKVVINTVGGWGSNRYTLTLPDNTVVGPQANATFTNLTQSGTYGISVTDLSGTGCTITDTFNVDAAIQPDAEIDLTLSDLCYDTAGKARIVVTPAVPSPSYMYNINDGNYQASGTFNNLIPGNYVVKVKDTNTGCILILAAQPIQLELKFKAELTKSPNCNGQDAEIKGTISGGKTPYTYTVTIDGTVDSTVRTVTGTTFTYTDPTATTATTNTTYLFTLTDASNGKCSLTSTVIVAPKTNPDFTATPKSTILCNGEATGSITVVIDQSKGVSPYTINVTKNNSVLPIPIANVNYGTKTTGLPAGTYIVRVTDDKGCYLDKTVVITEPVKIDFNLVDVQIRCVGGGSGTTFGSISVTNLTGGTRNAAPAASGYTYTLTSNTSPTQIFSPTGNEDHSFTVLNFGVYELTVSDINGCSVTKKVNMASPPEDLDIKVTPGAPSCTTASLIVTATPSIPGGPYFFAKYPIDPTDLTKYDYATYSAFYQNADALSPPASPGDPLLLQSTFNNLNPGVKYSFVVYDATTQCYYFKQADVATLTASTLVVNTLTEANVTCTGAGDGKVSFEFTGTQPATTEVKYDIYNSQTNLLVSPAVGGTVILPTNSANNVGPLKPGTYYILFTELDGTGTTVCMNSSRTFTITESVVPLVLNANKVKNDNCGSEKGVIEAFGQGGTTAIPDLSDPTKTISVPYLYQIFSDTGTIGLIDGTDHTDTEPGFAASFDVDGQTSNTFNKDHGDYIVYVRDANGCIRYKFVKVDLDPSPVFTAVANNICVEEGAFVIDVDITVSGVGTHYYSLDGADPIQIPSTKFSISNLSSGNHTVQIKDFNGCGDIVSLPLIVTPLLIEASFTTPPVCQDNRGVITAIVTGGATPNDFEYTLINNTVPATPNLIQINNGVFAGQAAGNYTVTVIDRTTNCTRSVDVDLKIPTLVDLVAADIVATPVNCAGSQGTNDNGTLTVNLRAVNDAASYTYVLTPVLPAGPAITQVDNNVFTGLSAGDYTVLVRSNKGCEETVNTNVPAPLAIVATADATPFSCAVDPTITTVVITGLGGTGDYTFSKDGTNYFASNSTPADNKYTFEIEDTGSVQNPTYWVKDANGCFQTTTLTAALQPLPKLISATATRDAAPGSQIDCDNGREVIQIDVVGGSVPSDFKYEVSIDGTGYTVLTNSAGTPYDYNATTAGSTYQFKVTDNVTGCEILTNIYNVPLFDAINVTATTKSDVTCKSATDGTIEIFVSGYTGPYTYAVYDGATPVATAGASGSHDTATSNPFLIPATFGEGTNYTVRIVETAYPLCSTTTTAVIISEPTVTFTLDPLAVTPLGCSVDGAVKITTQGGWGNNEYTLTPPTGPAITNKNGVFENLKTDGTYGVSVKDANGCTLTDSFTLDIPTPPVASIDVTSDYCYDTTNGATLVVKASLGVAPYYFSIDNGDTFLPSNSALPDDTYTFSNLTPGTYEIFVKDSYGCQSVAVVSTEIEKQLFATASNTKEIFCTGTVNGSIEIKAQGGYGSYTYTVEIDNGGPSAPIAFPTGSDTAVYTVTGQGTYEFVVSDARNCSYVITNEVVMLPPTAVTYTAVPTQPSCTNSQGELSNGSILITLDAGNDNPDYKYTITRTIPPGFTATQDNNGLFTGLTSGTYDIIVTSARGCSTPDTVVIGNSIPVLADATVSAFRCTAPNTINTTTVTVTGSGGAGTGLLEDYTYSENQIDWFDTNIFIVKDNRVAQTLTYYVKDANGCIDDVIVPFTPFPELTSIDVTFGPLMDCLNNQQVMDIVINGGTNTPNPFTYNVYRDGTLYDGPFTVTGNTFTYNATAAGHSYEFEVIDNNTGCSIKSPSRNVPVFDTIKVFATPASNVDCTGNATGAIAINIVDYNGPYHYEVYLDTNSTAITSGIGDTATANPFEIPFGFLAGQKYRVVVIEDAYPSCTATSNDVDITEPAPLSLAGFNVAVKNQNCTTLKAVLTIDPTTIVGGSGNYTYAVVPTTSPATVPGIVDYKPFTTIEIATTQIAPAFDSYDVYVKDAEGCFDHVTVTIAQDPAPAITNVAATQCPSTNNTYDITVTATGFTADLEYSIDGNTWQLNNNVLTVKTTGNHTVYVRDANKCQVTETVEILEPLQLIYDPTTIPTCTTATGVVTLTASGGSNNYQYSIDGITFVASNVFNNLAPGNYTFHVKDLGTPCTKSVDVVLEIPNTAIDFTLTASKVVCNGESNGTITVNMATPTGTVNNNPVYTYSINPSPTGVVLVGNVFKNLPQGLYTVTVTSGKGCPVSLDTTVDQPMPINVPNPVVLQYGCLTGNKNNYATITVPIPTGGSDEYKVYEFLKDGNPIAVQRGDSPIYTESDFLGHTYVINVYDTNGCLGTTNATINPYVAIDFGTPAVTVTQAITCNNDENIQVNVVTTGTTTPMPVLSYNVKGISAGSTYDQTNNDGAFLGLTIGNYMVTVTNPVTGCVLSYIHYINNPNTFNLLAENIKNVTCFGTSTGSVDLTIVDNQPDPNNDAGIFDYQITGPVNISDRSTGAIINIPNLPNGVYTVKAQLVGSPYCEVETTFIIDQAPSALTISETHTPITCDPGNDGTITASADGGWIGDYKFELVGPISYAYSDQYFFENLIEGTYTLNVKDVNDCIVSTTVILSNPKPILVTAQATVANLICNGDTNGEITVDLPTGGQETNYQYILNYLSVDPVISSSPQVSPVFSGLAAGTYSVTVIDGINCSSQPTVDIVINEPVKIQAELATETGITCKTDATLRLTAIGGASPYVYSTDVTFTTILGTFTSSATFSVGLGDHQYYVRDFNGCISTISNNVAINPLTPLNLNIDLQNAVVYCKGSSSAAIDAEAIGGLANYIYTLYDGIGNIVRPAQPNGYFDLLPQGTYVVRVDSGDCQYDSAAIVINEPNEALAVTSTSADATCFAANDGKITITATGGTGVIKYAISPNLAMFDDKFVFDRLTPGNYQVLVQDENSCFQLLDFEIKEPNILLGKVVGPITQEICNGDKDGAFAVEISGGTAPYSVSLDNEKGPYTPVIGNQHDFTGLSGGNHTVYIKDASCTTSLDVIMDKAVILDPTVEINYDCVNNSQANMVTVTIDKSNTDLTQVDYALDSDVGPWQPSNIFTNVAPGKHYIVARHTNGCIVPTASFDIKPYDPLTLALSSGQPEMNIISVTASGGSPAYEYSFNGEPFTSSNKYKIYKSGDYKVIVRDQNGCTSEIIVPAIYVDVCLDNYFTPNGDGVYDTWGPGCTNIYNNLEFSIFDRYGRVIAKYHYGQKWDGRYNGAELPSGDYWYVLKLNDEKDNREFVGHFTLYR